MLHCPPLLAPPRAVILPERRWQAEPPKTERRGGIGELRTEYEILLMLDPDAPEERQNEILERARELVERGGGTWDRHEPWGRRRLAYEIAHKEDGVYHLFEFTSDPDTLDELSRILKITDGVMRHMAVRRVQRSPGRPVARTARDGQDAREPVTQSVEE
jgi:small subunit ribosomal protein S6